MKKQWQKNETKDAKLFGAKQTLRSGGIWFAKGDSKSDKFLIDSKLTEKKSYSITEEIWKKLSTEALLSQRLPVLSVTFGKEKQYEIVVLDKSDFMELIK